MPKIKEMPPELQYFFEKGFSASDRMEAIVVNKSDNFVEQIAVKGRITLDDGVVRESEIRLNTLAADLIRKIGVAVECGRSQKINSIYAAILLLKDPNADSLQDDDDTLRAFHRKCIITNRLIRLLFRIPHVAQFKRLTDGRQMRPAMEYGAGIGHENYFQTLADLIGRNDAEEHKVFLPYDGPNPQLVTTVYDSYLQDLSPDERPWNELTGTITWKDVCVNTDNLMVVYGVMSKNYTESGNHQNDAMGYTDLALQRSKMRKTISPLNAYYFFQQLYFNSDVELKGNFTGELPLLLLGQSISDSGKTGTAGAKRKKRVDELTQFIASGEIRDNAIDARLALTQEQNKLQTDLLMMNSEKSALIGARQSALRDLAKSKRSKDDPEITQLFQESFDDATNRLTEIDQEMAQKRRELEELDADGNQKSGVSTAPRPIRANGSRRRSSTPSSVASSIEINNNTPVQDTDDDDDDNIEGAALFSGDQDVRNDDLSDDDDLNPTNLALQISNGQVPI
jgi:hypothetical protein